MHYLLTSLKVFLTKMQIYYFFIFYYDEENWSLHKQTKIKTIRRDVKRQQGLLPSP